MFSKITQKGLKNYSDCIALILRLSSVVFSTFKIKQLFIVKDFEPQGLRSHVVHEFTCAGDSCSTECFTILDSANSRLKNKNKRSFAYQIQQTYS